ncbi:MULTISPECIES: hypothetical protein [Bradyrhizobium]|uniref:hypothetical protein n=1 Tax=Bradyrhizobium TaxID=374 RepID=UPI0004058C14|nr:MULTISPECIES: hypothetical protein [Bradyrhizobium]QOG22738.1 hypothetical protein FOM02_41185 [Bradyrhizobium sp. SEMIA]UFW46231.1 hypothetical protein BaraCB756_28415 [Bradyrhizobium arachidis]
MIRHTVTLLLGLAILAAAYWVLASWPIIALVFFFLVRDVAGGLNVLWLAVIVGMMAFGATRRHPGLVAAPLLFFAAWFGVSVVDRYKAEAETDPSLAVRTIPAELKDIRTVTLVTRGVRGCCGQVSLLADHLVDRYVHAADDEKGHIGPIQMTELAAAKDCTAEELRRSELLQRAGRIGECLKTTTIDSIPDGLVVRMQPRPYYPMVGCCTVGTLNVRQNGEERVAATWHSGRRVVRSYAPLFGRPNAPDPTVSVWSGFAGGPSQMVWIGGPTFTAEDLAAAAYGIDWAAPPKTPDVSIAELIRRAVEISKGPTRTAALDIALAVQAKGGVNDELLRMMASFIELSSSHSPAYQSIQKFWFKLDPGRQRQFIDLIVARMKDPAIGFDYNRAELPFHWDAAKFPGIPDQALLVFEERRDLKTWQYELALRLAAKAAFGSDQYAAEQRQRFGLIRDDSSDAFSSRALAFKRVYFLGNDEQREFYADQLDRVPDAMLEQFLIATGWHRSPHEPNATVTTRMLRERAAARIAAVKDDKLRRDLQERFRLDRAS